MNQKETNKMCATSVIYFDKENKQEEYKYIARDMNGKLVIGWIVIEQPWYSPSSSWTYWMYRNKYGPGGFCGGASDLGFERIKVDPNTINPFNQIEEIKYDLENGFNVELIQKIPYQEDDKTIGYSEVKLIIHNEDEIPYYLWGKRNKKYD